MKLKSIQSYKILQVILITALFIYLYMRGLPTTDIIVVGVLFTAFTLVTHIKAVSLGMIYTANDEEFYKTMINEIPQERKGQS